MEGEYIKSSVNELLITLEKNKNTSSKNTIEFGLKVYSLCKKENYETGMAAALYNVGRDYFKMSKYEDAMPYLFDSINLSRRQNICDLQILTYLCIGDIYFDIEEYEKSLDYYNYAEKLSKIFEHSKNFYKNLSYELYAAKIYNNIGEIYRILKCYDDAIIYYNLAVELDRKLNYQGTFGVVLSNLGYVEYQLGNYNKALEYLNESFIYLNKNDYKIGLAEAYGIVALIHEKNANYEEGENFFYKAINISSETGYVYNKINLLLDFSNFLEKLGQKEIAINKLHELYNISISNKMYAKTLEVCKRAIRLYEEVNDINNANKYYKLYFENEKKLEHIELETRVRNLKIKVKLGSLEEENKSILEKSEAFRRKAEDLIKVIKNISIISELGEKITTTLDLNQIYEMLYDTIQSFVPANIFGVGLYQEEKRNIQYNYLMEDNERNQMQQVSYDDETSMAVKCLRENRIIVINDMYKEYLNYVEDVSYITSTNGNEQQSAIFCPLIIDNNLIGVMTVQANKKDSFEMLTIETIKALSSYAAIAINNAIKSMNLLVEIEQRRKVQIQLEKINNKLIYLSENDGLTNIPNRRKFDTTIIVEWNKAKDKKRFISIIIFDIDCFKQYNDNYGHTSGDNCLISITKELSKQLSGKYFAARYGGDEFVIILPDTNLEKANIYANNFRANVEKLSIPHKFSKVKDVVTVTLGISSVIPSNETTIIEFIRQADNALYEAKNKGRNQVMS